MDKRSDRLTATYVDLAINVCTAFGLSAAVRVLQDEGISPGVIQRVLIDGGPRRPMDRAPAGDQDGYIDRPNHS